jgi:hypothetical protein
MCFQIEEDDMNDMKSYAIRKHLHRIYSASKRVNQLVLTLPGKNSYKIWDITGDSFDRCLRESLQLHFTHYGE